MMILYHARMSESGLGLRWVSNCGVQFLLFMGTLRTRVNWFRMILCVTPIGGRLKFTRLHCTSRLVHAAILTISFRLSEQINEQIQRRSQEKACMLFIKQMLFYIKLMFGIEGIQFCYAKSAPEMRMGRYLHMENSWKDILSGCKFCNTFCWFYRSQTGSDWFES